MGTKLSSLLSDPKAAEDGVWVHIIGTWEMRLAYMSGPRYTRVAQKLLIEALGEHKVVNAQDLPDSVMEEIHLRSVAEGVILDWRGVYEDDGETPIPYDAETAYQTLANPKAWEIKGAVLTKSCIRDNYIEALADDASGKCEGGSDGTGNTATSSIS